MQIALFEITNEMFWLTAIANSQDNDSIVNCYSADFLVVCPASHMQSFQALQDDLRIKLALEMYEREHGAYPASLETLIPSYLDEMPVHPLGDGSYERTGDGYELSWRIES